MLKLFVGNHNYFSRSCVSFLVSKLLCVFLFLSYWTSYRHFQHHLERFRLPPSAQLNLGPCVSSLKSLWDVLIRVIFGQIHHLFDASSARLLVVPQPFPRRTIITQSSLQIFSPCLELGFALRCYHLLFIIQAFHNLTYSISLSPSISNYWLSPSFCMMEPKYCGG